MISEPESTQPAPQSFFTLARVGWLTAIVYLLTLLFYLKGPQSHTRTGRELWAWFLCLSSLFLFWKGYRIVKDSAAEIQTQTIILFAALFCLIALFTFPFHSTDVFGYINRGWQQVHYGQNPYVYRLGDVPGWQQDPMLREHWIYNPVPYGFLFTLIARLICLIGNGHWYLTLLLFKSINLLAYALTAFLVWSGTKHLGQSRPILALYTFLWNPLILMHHIANGHNDVLTGCLMTLSLYLAIVGAWFWVIPALVAAALLKYAPALLIPLAFVFVVKKKGWTLALLSCLVGSLIVVAVSAPYLKDWRLFRLEDIADNATLIDNSLHSFLIHIFENISRLISALAPLHHAVDSVIKNTLRLGFLAFLAYQFFTLFRKLSLKVLLEKSTLIMFVLFCVVSSKFNAWYLGMILPLALILEERTWLRRLIILITAAELLSLSFFKQAYILNYFAMILIPMIIIYRQTRREKDARQSAYESSDEAQDAALI